MYVAALAVGEVLSDEALVGVYDGRTLSVEATGGVTLPLPPQVPVPIEAKLTVGYRSPGGLALAPDGATPTAQAVSLWYAPIGLTAGPTFAIGPLDLNLSAGPVWVPWAETPGTTGTAGASGIKIGGSFAAEGRLHLREFGQGLHGPDLRRPDLLLVLGAGARVHHVFCPDDACGLDFGAVRVSAGLGVEIP